MLVLGIESTCDETACAVVKDGKDILSNVCASQHDIHSIYGGVFPELASRRHVDAIIPVLDQALNQAAVTLREIDLFAVANGPGLMGALLVGINTAKSLALACKKPLIGVNHVEAHLYASIMSQKEPISFPCIGVVLSGGHTSIVFIKDIGSYELLGQTADDAIGEAFDKVAKMMGLPYPGGPQIERLAKEGNPHRFQFKSGQVKTRPFDFSFSGTKTAVLYTINGTNGTLTDRSLSFRDILESDKADIAASFQHSVFTDVIEKTRKALVKQDCKTLLLGGGVTNNNKLREMFASAETECQIFWPSTGLSLDNAAMISGLGFHQYQRQGYRHSFDLEAKTRMQL